METAHSCRTGLLTGPHSPQAGPDLESLRMDQARIAALLADFVGTLDRSKTPASILLSNISIYIDILLRWNRRINLTAIRDPEEVVTRHFGESLFAAKHLFPHHEVTQAATVADVGSGAGFPGIPIKLWAPDISLTLIESNQKKATFLREVARGLTLTNINIQDVRAESISARSLRRRHITRSRTLRHSPPCSRCPAKTSRLPGSPDRHRPTEPSPLHPA